MRVRFGMVLLEALDLSSGHLRRLVLGKVPGLGLKSRHLDEGDEEQEIQQIMYIQKYI